MNTSMVRKWMIFGWASGRVLSVSLLFGLGAHLDTQAAQDALRPQPRRNDLLVGQAFIQIPGPNPILVRGGKGAWDEAMLEACDVFKDFETYYFYHHAIPVDLKKWGAGYRIGLATASPGVSTFSTRFVL